MFPIRDDNPTRQPPLVNVAIILSCIVVYLVQLGSDDGGETIVTNYGLIPARVTRPNEPLVIDQPVVHHTAEGQVIEHRQVTLPPGRIAPWMTFFTCMFLHGGLLHLFGNLWSLWIFGDNIEDRFGHVGYVLVYLLSGLAAGLLHFATQPNSPIPTIGASGAIAGVMGAYLVLYGHAQVLAAIPLGPIIQFAYIPAWIFLIVWFGLQVFSGLFHDVGSEGVAWWAHVGGFLAGAGLAGLFASPEPTRVTRARPW